MAKQPRQLHYSNNLSKKRVKMWAPTKQKTNGGFHCFGHYVLETHGCYQSYPPSIPQPHSQFGDSESVAPMDEAEIDRKHKELRDVTDTRIRSLEGLLKQRDADLQAKEETLALVTQDFHYNVNLIKERDEELQSFEDATDNMRQAIHERDEEAASLRAQLETAQEDAKTQRAHAAELQEHYQGQMLEIKTEREALKRQHETELHTRDDEIRTLTNQLQQQRYGVLFSLFLRHISPRTLFCAPLIGFSTFWITTNVENGASLIQPTLSSQASRRFLIFFVRTGPVGVDPFLPSLEIAFFLH